MTRAGAGVALDHAGKWWVEVHGQGLPGSIPSEQVPAALALAGFRAGPWSSCRVELKDHHPTTNKEERVS